MGKMFDSAGRAEFFPGHRQDNPSNGINTGAADLSPVLGWEDGETEMVDNFFTW